MPKTVSPQSSGQIEREAQLNDDDDIWRGRVAKRLAIVQAVKASPAYALCSGCSVRSGTPDPFDRKVSKRSWERSMQQFRQSLRDEKTVDIMAEAAKKAATTSSMKMK